jgi:ABC-2 type transport system permease protein
MRIVDLALKDLSQVVREKKSLLFLVAMPIIFTIFMGFAYKSPSGTQAQDNRIPLGWVNNDPDGALSRQLYATLSSSGAVRLVEQSPAGAEAAVRLGQVAGALIVPAGFSQTGSDGSSQLTLIADPMSTKGQSLYQLLRGPVVQLMSSVEIGRLSAEAVGRPAEAAAAFSAAAQAWAQTDSNALVKVEQAAAQKAGDPYGGNPYNQSSPGILVMFAVFGLVTSAQILVQERKTHTLQRLMTTAMKPWEIVAGHLLAMFAVVFLQTALLITFGQWVLKVDYLREPLATLLVAVAMGLWVASVGLLIGVLARGDEQVTLFSMIAMFTFSALGGTWFPLEGAGTAFATLGRLMPSAWAMNGFQNILIRGLGLGSAWMPAAILAAYALAFFGIAVWRFRKTEMQ